ncbi:2OG-Fe(II) oxygenase [Rhizorhabdus argentea]|uniref:2OG-Fe(II) oxygenase n=1 Tax=Rhizorhabdus argentea TaxID=1387174 RepID=UPI0030ECF7D0
MSILSFSDHQGGPGFDAAQCRKIGAGHAAAYAAAQPFPHIVLDELLDPALLRDMAARFPSAEGKSFFDRDQERLKFQFAPDEIIDARLRHLLLELNAPAFLGFLEALTGIGGLIPDPYYIGGGLHETRPGGHLSIHADFNLHKQMLVERRLNLLIYLNDDWLPDYGGDLELWDRDMKACAAKVAPILGRAVIFNTDADSYHGHPEPLACPPGRSRRSIATYYYTAPQTEDLRSRTTSFRRRPGSSDRRDMRVAVDHLIRNWVPPRLQPLARRLNRFR